MKYYISVGALILPEDDQERGLSGFWLTPITLRIVVRDELQDGSIVESTARLVENEDLHNV